MGWIILGAVLATWLAVRIAIAVAVAMVVVTGFLVWLFLAATGAIVRALLRPSRVA